MTNFLGVSADQASYGKARAVVLPVPYEATVSYGKGTADGPRAIIEASTQVELYDDELKFEPYHMGIATLDPINLKGVKPERLFEKISPAIGKILSDKKWPMMFGGEHSITPPAVRAVHELYPKLTVVQFDAHADLRDEYEGSKMSHACAMARVREICPAVQIGIRNISSEEARVAEAKSYAIYYANQLQRDDSWMDRVISDIRTDDVYITFDVDAFDGAILPATGTPEPGGMSWYQVIGMLRKIFERKRVVGMDIVELAPIEGLHACDFMVAKLAYKCMGYLSRNSK